jgi:hypothetical protein
MPEKLACAVVAVLVLVAAAGCSSDTRKAINETLARNAVATAGTKQFHDSGHSLDGLLTCKVQSRTTTAVSVGCTGTTDDDEKAALIGSTSDERQVKGHFVGTVNGDRVFTTDCLGC